MAGGAHGSLVSNEFSLEGYSRTDKPTLYFNYFLDSEATNSIAAMRDSARVFASRDGGISWELLATNNSVPSSITDPTNPSAELPVGRSTTDKYVTVSRDAYPAAPNQRVQELFDIDEPGAPDTRRQSRVDLADFAGEPNLMLRFDFSTAGSITRDGSMPGDQYGAGFADRLTALNNANEGLYIDDIIIGFAERGEMITGPQDQRNDSNFFQLPQNPVFGAPPQSLIGEYQLEIRRGTEYIGNDVIKFDWNDPNDPVLLGATLSPIYSTLAPGGPTSIGRETKILTTFDTNDRLADAVTMTVPSGTFIVDAELFTVGDGVASFTFEFDRDGIWDPSHVRIPFNGNETQGQMAQAVANAINAQPNLLVRRVGQTRGRQQLPGAFAGRGGTPGRPGPVGRTALRPSGEIGHSRESRQRHTSDGGAKWEPWPASGRPCLGQGPGDRLAHRRTGAFLHRSHDRQRGAGRRFRLPSRPETAA